MLTNKDIEKMIQMFAKVFATKEEINEVKDISQQTLEAVEPLASFIDRQEFENAATTTQLSRHKGWIHQIAKQASVKLAD